MSGQQEAESARQYLQSRGCSDAVVRGGLPHLLMRWREIADTVRSGYPGDLDEYLNDMDVRQLIAELKANYPSCEGDEAIIDAELRPGLLEARGCIWGRANAERNGWTPERNWWYFTHPRHMGEALRGDLVRRHLLSAGSTR